MPSQKRLAKIYGFGVVEQASDFCNGELGICEIFQRKNVLYLLFDCPKGTPSASSRRLNVRSLRCKRWAV